MYLLIMNGTKSFVDNFHDIYISISCSVFKCNHKHLMMYKFSYHRLRGSAALL